MARRPTCKQCRTHHAEPGYVTCAPCRATNQRRRERYKTEGRCSCGQPSRPGLRMCEECYDNQRHRRLMARVDREIMRSRAL